MVRTFIQILITMTGLYLGILFLTLLAYWSFWMIGIAPDPDGTPQLSQECECPCHTEWQNDDKVPVPP